MISKDTLHSEWIKKVSAENRKADKILIEKVIRALLLLEGLVQSGLDFVFKGGSSVMLLQGMPKRFSIDLPPDLVPYVKLEFSHFLFFNSSTSPVPEDDNSMNCVA
jgi:hypothetical protein